MPGNTGLPRAPRRARSRLVVVLSLATSTLVLTLGFGAAPAHGANTSTNRSQAASLGQKIAAEGSHVEALVTQYNQLLARLSSLQTEIRQDRGKLVSDQQAQQHASLELRRSAIAAYIGAESDAGGALSPLAGGLGASTYSAQQIYLGVARTSLSSAISSYTIDSDTTRRAQGALAAQLSVTAQALAAVAQARGLAQQAVQSDQALLASVNARLLAEINAQNAARQAAKAREQEAALSQAAAQPSVSAPAVSVQVQPAPGGYANPLRDVRGLAPYRIDQGVDYGGFGPIYALGDGVVLSVYSGGWPGGTFISYRLTDGPAAGLVVYAAEDIEPQVHIGEQVSASTVLGTIYDGPTGIETGWADGTGDGRTMAADFGQFYGGNATSFGVNFSQLLVSLGAAGGLGGAGSGTLPGSWPRW